MQSFRTELEDPIVTQDIIELEKKIRLFHEGQLDEEKFRSLRLARGIYGQRQPGVQMIRIKIPYGKLSTRQLIRIADLSDEYASSTLHATTRQDIQIHYVSLDKTPELWAKLEQDQITLREACGNTVRNITASPIAGIDPKEPFDVSPYAQRMFEYFLRNPVCQEMGRKFKISFSSNEDDSAFSFIHDLGFIPKLVQENGQAHRGFKVLLGGGLGAQPMYAQVAHEFLPENQLIPFTEAVLRVFDRYGERARRHKARMKYLVKDIGLEALLALVEEERTALPKPQWKIETDTFAQAEPLAAGVQYPEVSISDETKYQRWLHSNVFEQKQDAFRGVYLKLPLGNLTSEQARELATIVKLHAADELRVTVNQGYLLKFVRPEALPSLFYHLDRLGFAEPGFDSTADVTACPGTDTCNLGISSSTGIAQELERVIREEYPDLIYNHDIKIKISGCPNSCGQHGLAAIGFHGSSIKKGKLVLPALQVLLGGMVLQDGAGRFAERVIKLPSKRGPQALRVLLEDYESHANTGEYFGEYFERQGKMYFYHVLKPLANLDTLEDQDYQDWGQADPFQVQTAVGECAGVIIDLVATLLYEAEEKWGWAQEAWNQEKWADAIYHAHNAFISGAKALLLGEDVKTNTQISVLREFDQHFAGSEILLPGQSLKDFVLRINKNSPSPEFAQLYLEDARGFLDSVKNYRNQALKTA